MSLKESWSPRPDPDRDPTTSEAEAYALAVTLGNFIKVALALINKPPNTLADTLKNSYIECSRLIMSSPGKFTSKSAIIKTYIDIMEALLPLLKSSLDEE